MGCAFGLNLSELVFVLASFEIYRICAVPRLGQQCCHLIFLEYDVYRVAVMNFFEPFLITPSACT